MFNRLIPGLVAATWLWAVTATAETATYVSQGVPLFNFTVPDGWEANQGIEVTTAQMPDNIPPAPRVVSILPPGEAEAMWTGLWAPRAPRLDPPRRHPLLRPHGPRDRQQAFMVVPDQVEAKAWVAAGVVAVADLTLRS